MVLFTQEFSDPPLNKWRPCASCHAKGAAVTASQPSRGCPVSAAVQGGLGPGRLPAPCRTVPRETYRTRGQISWRLLFQPRQEMANDQAQGRSVFPERVDAPRAVSIKGRAGPGSPRPCGAVPHACSLRVDVPCLLGGHGLSGKPARGGGSKIQSGCVPSASHAGSPGPHAETLYKKI